MERKKILTNTTDIFLDNMLFYGASSAAVMLYQKGQLNHYNSTSTVWQDFYSTTKSAANCHIAQAGINMVRQNFKSFSIVWDAMKANNDDSLYLNEERERLDHCHGISICEAMPNDTLFGIILTGRRCDVNFANLVLKNKANLHKQISHIKSEISKIYQYHH